jgi:hypothetical protein
MSAYALARCRRRDNTRAVRWSRLLQEQKQKKKGVSRETARRKQDAHEDAAVTPSQRELHLRLRRPGLPWSRRRETMPRIEQDLEQSVFHHLILPELLLLSTQRPVLDLGLHQRQQLDFFQASGANIVVKTFTPAQENRTHSL